MTQDTTVASLLAQAVGRFKDTTVSGVAALDIQLLLAHVLATGRSWLLAHPEHPLSNAECERFWKLLRRRSAGEPLAYLTGRREFWSLELMVNPDVLIPRPETELLVERALALRTAPTGRVADLGTGSGAIAIAIARERPRWQLLASDNSAAALAVAQANALALGAHIEFRQGDWYTPLAGERFDLLLSNPPYVAADDPAMQALQHEPRLALTPGRDSLACLRILAHGAAQHLNPGGWLILEHGAGQGAQLRDELVLAGLRHVTSHRDLAGRERITEGQQ
jgi:release factor glutamine methyltransferase